MEVNNNAEVLKKKSLRMVHSVEKRTKPGPLVETDFFSVKTVIKWLEMPQKVFVWWCSLQGFLKHQVQVNVLVLFPLVRWWFFIGYFLGVMTELLMSHTFASYTCWWYRKINLNLSSKLLEVESNKITILNGFFYHFPHFWLKKKSILTNEPGFERFPTLCDVFRIGVV